MNDALTGRHVLLGVTGGIAAYKAALVARLLVGHGAVVDTVLTAGARRFVGAATFEGLTGRAVRDEVWDDIAGGSHVRVGQRAEVVLVYPATAHTLARLAHGLADDLLTTTLLAATCPVVLAPAMHAEMWQHPATRDNAALLRSRGVRLLGPDTGVLMGGDHGPGRVVEPELAVTAVAEALVAGPARRGASPATSAAPAPSVAAPAEEPAGTRTARRVDPGREQDLAGQRLVVTAGGTREPIDPVRYLGNRSSGRMGFAIAERAAARGAVVDLVAAPTTLPTPAGVVRHDVVTARDMRTAVLGLTAAATVVVKAAAVADFRPASVAATKLKKEAGAPHLELTPNPDILAELGQRRRTGVDTALLVGFAAETDDVERHARAKLERKGADLLVVNDVSAADAGFEVETNRVFVLDRFGGRTDLPFATKQEVADRLLDLVVARLAAAR